MFRKCNFPTTGGLQPFRNRDLPSPVHFRRRVRPRRPRQFLSNSIKWGNSRYYRTPGLKLPNYTQTNGHDEDNDDDNDDDDDDGENQGGACASRRSSKSSFTMNPPFPDRADPRGHFRRVCFDSKFPVKLVTGTGPLSDPANSHVTIPLVSCLRIFRAVQREHAVLSTLRIGTIYLESLNITKKMLTACKK